MAAVESGHRFWKDGFVLHFGLVKYQCYVMMPTCHFDIYEPKEVHESYCYYTT